MSEYKPDQACDVCAETPARLVRKRYGQWEQVYLCERHRFNSHGALLEDGNKI